MLNPVFDEMEHVEELAQDVMPSYKHCVYVYSSPCRVMIWIFQAFVFIL